MKITFSLNTSHLPVDCCFKYSDIDKSDFQLLIFANFCFSFRPDSSLLSLRLSFKHFYSTVNSTNSFPLIIHLHHRNHKTIAKQTITTATTESHRKHLQHLQQRVNRLSVFLWLPPPVIILTFVCCPPQQFSRQENLTTKVWHFNLNNKQHIADLLSQLVCEQDLKALLSLLFLLFRQHHQHSHNIVNHRNRLRHNHHFLRLLKRITSFPSLYPQS